MKNSHIVFPFFVVALYCLPTRTEASFNLGISLGYCSIFNLIFFTFNIGSLLTEVAASDSKKRNVFKIKLPKLFQSETVPLINSSFSEEEESVYDSRNLESNSNKSKMEESNSNSNPLEGVVCDFSLNLPGITTKESTLKTTFHMEQQKVLCVQLENRVSTGFIWALLGAFNKEPTISPSMFPMDIVQMKHLVSSSIIATQPKSEVPKVKNEIPNPSQNNGGGGLTPYRAPLLGGSTTASSKIKPLEVGIFYVAYACYRPFNIGESPNVRILELHVH